VQTVQACSKTSSLLLNHSSPDPVMSCLAWCVLGMSIMVAEDTMQADLLKLTRFSAAGAECSMISFEHLDS
jgi:hypothetical protein